MYKRQPLGHLDYEQFTSFRYWKQKTFPIFFNCWLNNEHEYKFVSTYGTTISLVSIARWTEINIQIFFSDLCRFHIFTNKKIFQVKNVQSVFLSKKSKHIYQENIEMPPLLGYWVFTFSTEANAQTENGKFSRATITVNFFQSSYSS